MSLIENENHWHQITDPITDPNCHVRLHDKDLVSSLVAKAENVSKAFPTTVPIEDRLAVSILFSHGFFPSDRHTHNRHQTNRINLLRCSLRKLKEVLLHNTTADVYVWYVGAENETVTPEASKFMTTTVKNINSEYPRVHFMLFPESTWQIPCGLVNHHRWSHRTHIDVDYYLMGRWRMTTCLDFAKARGYRYHLQLDDDAILQGDALTYNVIDKLRGAGTEMAFFSDYLGTPRSLTVGLCELTRFWIKRFGYKVQGALFSTLVEQNLNGLTTDGWNTLAHPGYFILIDLDFWLSEDVQSYLTAIFRSGQDIESFYTEQTVMNMVSLVFVRPERLLVVKDIDIFHNRARAPQNQKLVTCLQE